METIVSHKPFAERLNQALDDIGAPEHREERIDVFARLAKIHRFKAETLLNGTAAADAALLTLLAREFEVSESWLLGRD